MTILFSLALVLSHLTAFASPVRQLCKNATPCGCGNASCCVQASDASPVPVVPAPALDNAHTQLLAALQAVTSLVLAQLETSAPPPFFPILPAPADVPLFIRNCSYLI